MKEILVRLPRAFEVEVAIRRGGAWRELSNYKAIIGENGQVYDIVSKRYQLIQHEDIVKAVNKVLEEYDIDPLYIKPDISIDGSKMFYNVILKKVNVNDDKCYLGFRITNSYDRSIGIHINGYGMRYACSNQMIFANKLLGQYAKHLKPTVELDFKKLKEKIETVIGGLVKIEEVLILATKKTVSPYELIEFIEKEFNVSNKLKMKIYFKIRQYTGVDLLEYKEKLEEMKKVKVVVDGQEITPINIWEAYNGITDALTHHTKRIDPVRVHELQKKASLLLIKN
ncbi:MAG: DUF932 domain-containing protein [Desulfonauticus sp.]|nr:DUF932 domain-containing protein [Desulfonauticus sp.]